MKKLSLNEGFVCDKTAENKCPHAGPCIIENKVASEREFVLGIEKREVEEDVVKRQTTTSEGEVALDSNVAQKKCRGDAKSRCVW